MKFPLSAAAICLGAALQAAPMVVDDFQWATPPTADLSPVGWVQATAAPKTGAQIVALGGSNVLRVPGAGGGGYNGLTKPAQVLNGALGTLRFRMMMASGTAVDMSVGLANQSATESGSNLAQVMAGSLRFLGPGAVTILDGGTGYASDQTFAADTWYAVTMVQDTVADRWTASVTGGAFANATPLTRAGGTVSTFAFRGSTGSAHLEHFALRTNAGHPAGANFYLDDITLESSAGEDVVNKADGYRGIWFALGQVTAYGDKYSGGLGTYTANHNPLAIYAPAVNKTFFVYGGTKVGQRHLLLMASYYDHTLNTVPRPTIVYDKQGVDDPHDNPAISIDGAGYIWVLVAGRNTSRDGVLLVSTQPYSTDAFREVRVMPGVTYPQPWYDAARGKFLLMFTKYTGGRELYVATSANGTDWSADRKLVGFGGHYQVSAFHAATGKVGTFFNYHPGGNVDERTNLYYMQSTDFGATWTTVTGAPLTIPLNAVSNPALVENYAAQGLLQYTCDLNWDKHGNPLMLYVSPRDYAPGPAGNPREWRLTRWTGTEWSTRVITTSTHAYDMGSLFVEGDRWKVIAPTGAGPGNQVLGLRRGDGDLDER